MWRSGLFQKKKIGGEGADPLVASTPPPLRREVLNLDMRWQVGSGQSISIWHDIQLPTQPLLKLYSNFFVFFPYS